jgi:malate synthase
VPRTISRAAENMPRYQSMTCQKPDLEARRRSNHLIAEAMTIDGRGKALMAAVLEYDLEGIVAKRKSDPYRRGVHWWKIKNPAYSQAEGRHELFNLAGWAVPAVAVAAAKSSGG